VTPPAPVIAPFNVVVLVLVTAKVSVLTLRLMLPLNVKLFVPPMVPVTLPALVESTVMGLATDMPLLFATNVPPFKFNVPVPIGPFVMLPVLLTPKLNVPAFSVVVPVYVFAPLKVNVPVPTLTRLPGPLIMPT